MANYQNCDIYLFHCYPHSYLVHVHHVLLQISHAQRNHYPATKRDLNQELRPFCILQTIHLLTH